MLDRKPESQTANNIFWILVECWKITFLLSSVKFSQLSNSTRKLRPVLVKHLKYRRVQLIEMHKTLKNRMHTRENSVPGSKLYFPVTFQNIRMILILMRAWVIKFQVEDEKHRNEKHRNLHSSCNSDTLQSNQEFCMHAFCAHLVFSLYRFGDNLEPFFWPSIRSLSLTMHSHSAFCQK